jgi:hypothetical protein
MVKLGHLLSPGLFSSLAFRGSGGVAACHLTHRSRRARCAESGQTGGQPPWLPTFVAPRRWPVGRLARRSCSSRLSGRRCSRRSGWLADVETPQARHHGYGLGDCSGLAWLGVWKVASPQSLMLIWGLPSLAPDVAGGGEQRHRMSAAAPPGRLAVKGSRPEVVGRVQRPEGRARSSGPLDGEVGGATLRA